MNQDIAPSLVVCYCGLPLCGFGFLSYHTVFGCSPLKPTFFRLVYRVLKEFVRCLKIIKIFSVAFSNMPLLVSLLDSENELNCSCPVLSEISVAIICFFLSTYKPHTCSIIWFFILLGINCNLPFPLLNPKFACSSLFLAQILFAIIYSQLCYCFILFTLFLLLESEIL